MAPQDGARSSWWSAKPLFWGVLRLPRPISKHCALDPEHVKRIFVQQRLLKAAGSLGQTEEDVLTSTATE